MATFTLEQLQQRSAPSNPTTKKTKLSLDDVLSRKQPAAAPAQPSVLGKVDEGALGKSSLNMGGALGAAQNDRMLGASKGVGETLGNVGKAIIASEKGFGESIADAIYAPFAVKQLNKENEQQARSSQAIIDKVKRDKAAGKDVTKLVALLKRVGGEQASTKLEEIVPSINKTGKQVLGEAGGVALDIATAGTYGAAAKGAKAGQLARGAPSILGIPQKLEGGIRGIIKATGKGIAKGAASGAASGGAISTARAFQEGKTGDDVTRQAITGAGVGAVLGGAIGGVSGLSKGVSNARKAEVEIAARQKRFDDFFNNTVTLKKMKTKMTEKGTDVGKILASNDRYIPEVVDGKVNPEAAISRLQDDTEPLAKMIRKIIEVDDQAVSIDTLRRQAIKEVKDLRLRGDEYNRVVANIEKDFASFAENYGVGPNKANIPLTIVDDIKKAKYGEINWNNPDLLSADRAVARASRKVIESTLKDSPIQKMNRELGKLYDAQEMLEKMGGRAVKHGLLGKHFIRTGGFIAGSPAGVPGSLAGGVTADMLADAMQTNYFSSGAMRALVGELKTARPEVFAQAENIIAKKAADKASRLQLPLKAGAAKSAPVFVTPGGKASPILQEASDIAKVETGVAKTTQGKVPKRDPFNDAFYEPEKVIDFGKKPKKVNVNLPVVKPDVAPKVAAGIPTKVKTPAVAAGAAKSPETIGQSFKYNAEAQLRRAGNDELADKVAALDFKKAKTYDQVFSTIKSKLGADELKNEAVVNWVRTEKMLVDELPEAPWQALGKAGQGKRIGRDELKRGAVAGFFGIGTKELTYTRSPQEESPATTTDAKIDRMVKILKKGKRLGSAEDGLKPETVKLAKAIAQIESGGKQRKGASGEFGIFQFMPATWKSISKQVMGREVPQTPENETRVAMLKIQQLLEKGHTPKQVALIWNTSLGGVEKPLVKRGVNSKGVKYDSEAYANKVIAQMQKLGKLKGKS